MAEQQQRGHATPPAPSSAPPPDEAFLRMKEHQAKAPRLSFASECRTLVALSRYAVLSTLSVAPDTAGFPSGSVVGYAEDASGRPLFSLSTMSGHTRDLMADGRASLTVTQPGFRGAADARVALTGDVARVPAAEEAAARAAYARKHPDAFWASFGDFSFWRLEPRALRLVGGFARAGSVAPALYASSQPDPVAGECARLIAAANARPAGALAAAADRLVAGGGGAGSQPSLPPLLARCALLSLDSLGADAAASLVGSGDEYKLRLPWRAACRTADEVGAEMRALGLLE